MPLTDEEWIAFINEYNGMVDDVGRFLQTLIAACQGYQRSPARADGREGLQQVVRTLTVVVGVQSQRIQDRIRALSRRINEMRALGEL
ncbi:MAG TPA: hypothetical protein VEM95_02755 [Thermoplasmata archaeon]|nr:hypothetical protein [Thermoplasmata archaeon]